jgi:hypothetical protein
VNVPAVPTVNAVLFALLTPGACATVSVKLWVALGRTPFCAVIVIGYVPPVLAPGVPARIPVAAVKVTPAGRVPVTLKVGAGVPVAVTVKVPAVPTVNVVVPALVIVGGWLTVNVKLWVAFAPTPF